MEAGDNGWRHRPDGGASIADYAAIGDCRSVALVSRAGSIDWLCLPEFSSPPVFDALLDARHGARFSVRPRDVESMRREYLGDSCVLQTTFHCRSGALRLTDAMTVPAPNARREEFQPLHEVLRLAECLEGEAVVDVRFSLRTDYGRRRLRLVRRGRLGWHCAQGGTAAGIHGDVDLAPDRARENELAGTVALRAGQACRLVFSHCGHDVATLSPLDEVPQRLDATRRWWEAWASRCTYAGRYRGAVMRSCLTLKLLTYHLSGAVVAAATTSLPESADGARSWDYRYCWLRDASMLLQSFIDLGFPAEAEAFLGWLLHATRVTRPQLGVLYDVHGRVAPPEREIDTLPGFRGQGPVRIGNGARDQSQHDVYGQVLLTARRFVEHGGRLDAADRRLLRQLGELVIDLWRRPDHGIWEIRLPPRHNTHSKFMCWAALDSLLALDKRIDLGIDADACTSERERIRGDIERRGFDAELGSYVGYYDGEAPDASLLLLPRYGYVAADDPRMLATARRIEARLGRNGMLYRYPPGGAYDGVGGSENPFVICSFWLVDYLARLGDTGRAAALFERLCSLSNDVGLYAEEFDARNGEPFGNFPQAFSHEGLVTAALALDAAERAGRMRQ